MPGNGLPQLRRPLIGQGQQQLLTIVQNHLPLEPNPHGEGKLPGAVARQVHRQRLLRRRLDCPGLGRHRRQGPLLCLHKEADFFPGADIPLRQQLGIGSLHRGFAHLQIGSQRPLGGQLVPGPQHAGENILPDAPVQ